MEEATKRSNGTNTVNCVNATFSYELKKVKTEGRKNRIGHTKGGQVPITKLNAIQYNLPKEVKAITAKAPRALRQRR